MHEKGEAMKTFILLTKLSQELSKHLNDREIIGRRWLKLVKEKCPEVKFVSHYALLGPYDFMDIYEAPNDETAAKVSLLSTSNGAAKAETIIAIPYKHFLELAEEVQDKIKILV